MFSTYPELNLDLEPALRHLATGTIVRIMYDAFTGLGMYIQTYALGGWGAVQFKTTGRYLTVNGQVFMLLTEDHHIRESSMEPILGYGANRRKVA